MLTPNDIKSDVDAIKSTQAAPGDLGSYQARAMRMALFTKVLCEIASGSIDPKSLAIAALKAN